MKRFAMAFLLSVLVVGCQDRRTATAPDANAVPGGIAAAISDGAHTGGNPDFFFLPPLVPNPSSNSNFDRGEFNSNLRPVVRVFPLPALGAAGCDLTGAVYGPVVASVNGGEEQYQVNWNTRASTLVPGTIYRICVFSSSEGTLLGFLDVAPIAGGMRNARTEETYAFQDDRTLPIKFRIEQGALCAPGALACTAGGVIGATADTIVLPSRHAAVVIPVGAVADTDTVTIVIAKQAPAYTEGAEAPQCLPGDLVQSQGCYHFSTEPPNYQFLTPVRIEACVNVDSLSPDQADRLVLYRYSGTGNPVLLPPADTTEIDCSGFVLGAADANVPTSLAGAVWRGAQRFLGHLLSPAVLAAAPMATPPKGLGGLAGSFSDVGGAVPPATQLSFTVQPADATAGVAIAPAVKVTVQDTLGRTVPGQSDTITVFINYGSPGATLGGVLEQPAVNGVATFADLTVDKAGSGYALSAGSNRGLNGDTSTAFTITAGPVSASSSVVTVSSGTVESGSAVTLTLQAKDAAGNDLTTGGAEVVFSASTGSGVSTGTISPSPATYDVSGRYTATFTGLVTGTATTIGATIGGSAVTSTAAVTVVVGAGTAASTATSVVSVSSGTVASESTVTLTLQAKNSSGTNLTTGGLSVVFTRSGGTSTGTVAPTTATDNGNGTYTATFTGVLAGTETTIGATINTVAVTSALPTVTVTVGPVSTSQSTVTAQTPIVANGSDISTITVTAKDGSGNPISGATVTLWADGAGNTLTQPSGTTNASGVATGTLSSTVAQQKTVSATINVWWQAITPMALVTAAPRVASIESGESHTCELSPAGAAYCWGLGNSGQLGNGGTSNATAPVAVAGGLTFAALSAGAGHTCGLTSGGTAYCWGYNVHGEVGNGTVSSPVTTPATVGGGLLFDTLSAGVWHTCGLTTAGNAYCWGFGLYSQLGNGTPSDRSLPTPVSQGSLTFAALTAGEYHTCALTSAGKAYCWGFNTYGELGDGSTTNSPTPVAVAQGSLTFVALRAGYQHTCGLASDGKAYCWGYNWNGALGNGGPYDASTPTAVTGGLTFTSLSKGWSHTCGLASDGEAYCWGYGLWGQLGYDSDISSASPVLVLGGLTFAALSTGGDASCGLTPAGAVYCWGRGDSGQLGNGTTPVTQTTPVVALQPLAGW